MKVEFVNPFPTHDMYYAAQATRGRLPSLDDPVPKGFADRMLVAEHSVLSIPIIRVTDASCRSDVVSHMVRHTKGHPRHFVQSRRPDWTGAPRPTDPGAPRLYVSTWPLDALMAMARQRLCFRAMVETRLWVSEIRLKLFQFWSNSLGRTREQEDLAHSVYQHMMPACIYRGGCPEGKQSCGYWEAVKAQYEGVPLKDRGAIYNKEVGIDPL